MTGLEMLQKLASEMPEDNVWTGMLRNELASICADIERDMDALVKDSPYDALPPDEREAIAWVREHGGLEALKNSLSALELLAEGIEIDTGLALYDESPKERCVALRNEVKSRLMPEGMEWPRTEEGEPVKLGDQLIDDDELEGWREVDTIIFQRTEDGYTVEIENDRGVSQRYEPGERVKRPAPKALDADGVECHVGDAVWWVSNKTGNFRIIRIEPDGKCAIRDNDEDEPCGMTVPSTELTHMRPVLDADGVEIRVGDTVWPAYPSANKGARVERAEVVGIHEEFGRVDVQTVYETGMSFREQVDAEQLTHRAPVLAADGKPLREGETVYHVADGRACVVREVREGRGDGRAGGRTPVRTMQGRLPHPRAPRQLGAAGGGREKRKPRYLLQGARLGLRGHGTHPSGACRPRAPRACAGGWCVMRTREDMRGRMLDRDCYRAEISKHEGGPDDDRCFCYGLVDKMTGDYLPKCQECGAFVSNATPMAERGK